MNIFEKSIYLHKMIEADLAEIKRLRELAMTISSPDPAKEFSGGFSPGSRFASLIDKIIDMEENLADEINNKLDLENAIYKLIDKLDPQSALVLRKRYVEGMSARAIAAELSLGERRVHDIISRAVKKCEEMHFNSEENAV